MKGFDWFGICYDLKTIRNELEFLKENVEIRNKLQIQERTMALGPIEQILRDILYDAEDFMEKREHMLDMQKIKYIKFPFSKGIWERRKRLKEIKKNITRYEEEIKLSLKLDHILSNQQLSKRIQSIHYPTLVHDEEVVGLDSDLENIKQWVLKENEPLKVIGIWGMGGVGKTALAQKICKDRRVKEFFDCVLFITISSSFDLRKLLIDILLQMEGNEVPPRGDELGLLEELNKQLNGKRYLIILDGVWQIDERSWWNSLKSALPQKSNGSCVIVTTRLNKVARVMGATERHLHYHKTLSANNSWLLFAKIAFPREHGPSPNPYVEGLAKRVAAKCGGLPLAIKVIAGVMLSKEPSASHWRTMSQHLKEELHNNSELLDFSLRISYEELPLHLKHCMLFFSVFPKHYEISLEEVVHLWASHGLIHMSEGRTTFENGEECFDELINRSLLLGERKDIFETRYQTCRVHDMIHNMVIKVAKEKNFMLLEEGMSLSCSTRVAFTQGSNMDYFNKFNNKLRILVGREMPENKEFVLNMKSKVLRQTHLRALDLSFTENDLPDEVSSGGWLNVIGSLSLLSCLKIQNSRLNVLPKCIMNLTNLQTLCLSQCYRLHKLPPEVGYLKKLTTLDVSSCAFIKYLPMQIESLSNLEILLGFKPSNSEVKRGCRMASLKKLTELRKLWMQIHSDDQVEKDCLVVLSDLKKLEVLAITLEDNSNLALIKKLDCELPSPLEELHYLYLHYFPGVDNPQWLNPTSIPNLSFLHIYESNIKNFSPRFFGNGKKVWQLEALVLTSLNELEEEWPRMQTAMPCLRLLKVDECPKLKSLPCVVENGLGRWMNI